MNRTLLIIAALILSSCRSVPQNTCTGNFYESFLAFARNQSDADIYKWLVANSSEIRPHPVSERYLVYEWCANRRYFQTGEKNFSLIVSLFDPLNRRETKYQNDQYDRQYPERKAAARREVHSPRF